MKTMGDHAGQVLPSAWHTVTLGISFRLCKCAECFSPASHLSWAGPVIQLWAEWSPLPLCFPVGYAALWRGSTGPLCVGWYIGLPSLACCSPTEVRPLPTGGFDSVPSMSE